MLALGKELLAGLHHKVRRQADLVFRAKLLGEQASFAIHVEPQASYEEGFPLRVFYYFARVHEKYSLPVYPIALLSYKTPNEVHPSELKESILGEDILKHNYKIVQLNRMNWKSYVQGQNPVAASLMAKMLIAKNERPAVRFQCMSMLATFKELPADSQAIILKFIDAYLVLKPDENLEYEEMVSIRTSWERKAHIEGRQEGLADLVSRQLTKRFGSVEENLLAQIRTQNSEQLEALAEALIDFSSVECLHEWLASYQEMIENAGKKKGEDILDLRTSWEIKGYEQGYAIGLEIGHEMTRMEGLQDGRLERELHHEALVSVLICQIEKRFGFVDKDLRAQIRIQNLEQLEDLVVDLGYFKSVQDLLEWLAQRSGSN